MNTPTSRADPRANHRLLIVDRHALLCQSLQGLFLRMSIVEAVAVATTAEKGRHTAASFVPHVVLLGAWVDPCRGFDFEPLAKACRPETGIIFLDDTLRRWHVREALRYDLGGYWTKQDDLEALVDGVRRVAAGQTSFCPAVQRQLIQTKEGWVLPPEGDTALDQLTDRQRETLVGLAEGHSVRECARRMGISESTVDNHKSLMMKKLGIHKVSQLVRLAYQEGLLRVP